MRNSYCKGKKNRLQAQTMTKSNASFNVTEGMGRGTADSAKCATSSIKDGL